MLFVLARTPAMDRFFESLDGSARRVRDSGTMRTLALAGSLFVALAVPAAALQTTRVMQLRYLPVATAVAVARRVPGVVATGDARLNKLMVSGASDAVDAAMRPVMLMDVPPRRFAATVVVVHAPSGAAVWAGIVMLVPGRAATVEAEAASGLSAAAGAEVKAVRGQVKVGAEGGRALVVTAKVVVQADGAPVELAGTIDATPDKPARVAASGPLALDVTVIPSDPKAAAPE